MPSVSDKFVSNSQIMSISSTFELDYAGEETLRSTSSSYSNFNQSLMRSQRNSYASYLYLCSILFVFICFFLSNLRSYGYTVLLKQDLSSIKIARYMEHSDGKK